MSHPSRSRSRSVGPAQAAALVLLALLISFFTHSLRAADEWDTTDYALGAVALAATVLDWGQTRYIAKNPDRFHERNPILGDHPSVGQVNTYFIGAIALGAVISNYLPSKKRKWFLGAAAAVEIAVTAHNHQLGVRVQF